MINIENAYRIFDEYVSHYDPEQPRIKLKTEHIKRVAKNSKKIAEDLGLSKKQIELAELIGIFHDLGRFEQVRLTDTFSDKDSGINHAELSAKVLFEDGEIRKYIEETKYDEIIKKAVLNHNKAKIDAGLTEEELLFAKIIRDADKLDIFFTTVYFEFEPLFWYHGFDQKEINPLIVKQFEKHELIHYDMIKNNADQIPIFYAYIYDLNFDSSLKTVVNQKYLDGYTERLKKHFTSPKVHEQADYALGICHEYFKQKGLE